MFTTGIAAPFRSVSRHNLVHLYIRAVLITFLYVLSPWGGILGSLTYLKEMECYGHSSDSKKISNNYACRLLDLYLNIYFVGTNSFSRLAELVGPVHQNKKSYTKISPYKSKNLFIIYLYNNYIILSRLNTLK